MKYIFVNLKRFDIPPALGGVNRIAPVAQWGSFLVEKTQDALRSFDAEFTLFLPEAHLLNAIGARNAGSPLSIGSQGVYREDTAVGGNFGAFTSNRTANIVKALGCDSTLIGHCEERKDKAGLLAEAGVSDTAAVDQILAKEVRAAQKAGLKVLFCVGEDLADRGHWRDILKAQLETGLNGADMDSVVIGYEPVWSIGPGKTPADKEDITAAARFIKECTGGADVVYGGGLKADNAGMLASIPQIDGGLIALTRFTGEIGFYPDEFLEIVRLYLSK